MDNVEILQKVKDLISDPYRHITGYLAVNAQGRNVAPNDPEATCWCVLGAVGKVMNLPDAIGLGTYDPVSFLEQACEEITGCDDVGDYNDTREHTEVLALVDLAIQYAEAAQ